MVHFSLLVYTNILLAMWLFCLFNPAHNENEQIEKNSVAQNNFLTRVFKFPKWIFHIFFKKAGLKKFRPSFSPFAVSVVIYVVLLIKYLETGKIPTGQATFSNFALGLAITVIIGWFGQIVVEDARQRMNVNPPYFSIFGKTLVPMDRKVSLIFAVWILTLFITSSIAISQDLYGEAYVSKAFYTSWIGDVLFFSVVGISVAISGLRHPEEEDFDSRIKILFKNSKSEEHKVIRNDALKSIGNNTKRLGFVCKDNHWQIEVEEYNKKYGAYKVRVQNSSTLINLFDDVKTEDDMKFTISPDDFSGAKSKNPTLIGEITGLFIMNGKDYHSIINKPIEIKSTHPHEKAIGVKQKFIIDKKEIVVVYHYWLWVKTDLPWTMRVLRYTDLKTTSIINSIPSGDVKVRIKCLNPADGAGGEAEIEYGNLAVLSPYEKTTADTKLHIVEFLPPR